MVTRPHESILSFSAIGESGVNSWLNPLVVTLDSHMYQFEVYWELYTVIIHGFVSMRKSCWQDELILKGMITYFSGWIM